MENQMTKVEWVSVKQKLPPNSDKVLVYNRLFGVGVDWIDTNVLPTIWWRGLNPYLPTHWAEYPEVPDDDL
jgi:hypothetical protein